MADLSKQPSVCAYCDGTGPFTKDHVWPSGFLDRVGRTAAHFSVKAGKVHGSDYVVRDVCAKCNNHRLSPLDAYLCRLYDTYFEELRDFDSTVAFKYDWDLLARTLLKVAYNSSRAGVSDPVPLARVRKYILGLDPRPKQLAIYLEVVSPSVVTPKGKSKPEKVFPAMYRSAVTQLLTEGAEHVLTRVVAVNSFYFHLMLPKDNLSNKQFGVVAEALERLIDGTVRLKPGQSSATIRSSPQDGLRSIAPHIRANADQYRQFFAKRGKPSD